MTVTRHDFGIVAWNDKRGTGPKAVVNVEVGWVGRLQTDCLDAAAEKPIEAGAQHLTTGGNIDRQSLYISPQVTDRVLPPVHA